METVESDFSNFGKLCGKIYYKNNNFQYVCTICDSPYFQNNDNLFMHLKKNHIKELNCLDSVKLEPYLLISENEEELIYDKNRDENIKIGSESDIEEGNYKNYSESDQENIGENGHNNENEQEGPSNEFFYPETTIYEITPCVQIKSQTNPNENSSKTSEKKCTSNNLSSKKTKLLKKLRPRKNWKDIKHFNTKQEVDEFILKEKSWSPSFKQHVKRGTKQYFRCNQVMAKGQQCAAQLYFLHGKESKNYIIFRSLDEHNCMEIRKKCRKTRKIVSNKLKEENRKSLEQKLGKISNEETLNKNDDVNVRKISNYLINLKPQLQTKPHVSIGNIDLRISKNQNKLVKKSRPRKDWKEVNNLNTKEEIDEFMSKENSWSASKKQLVKRGTKQYFRCNKVMAKGQQCLAQIYVLHERESKKYKLFRSIDEHNCLEIINQTKCKKSGKILSDTIKEEIKKLFEQELTPVSIYETLKNEYEIDVRQIRNYLITLRSHFGTKHPKLRSEITTWMNSIQNLDSRIPKNPIKPFVVSHTNNETEFRLFISSKRLIYNAVHVENIYCFGEKKINWKSYYLHIIGNIDCNQKFHPFGIGVCPSNKVEDFTFLLESVKEGCLKIYQIIPYFKFLIRDSCVALQTAFENCFGKDTLTRICWDYARKKIKRKLDEFLPREDKTRQRLLNDLDLVQQSESEDLFQRNLNSFVDTWSMCVKFITYLYQEWIDNGNKNWYNIPMGAISKSNSLRLLLAELENDESFRERLPVEQFREKVFEWIENWSKSEEEVDISGLDQTLKNREDIDFEEVDVEIHANDFFSTGKNAEENQNISLKELEALVERKKIRKFGKQWQIEKIFQTKLEAEQAIEAEGIWSHAKRNKTKVGQRIFYRCKKVISHGKQCEAGVSLLFKSDSFDVILMRSALEHTCHKIGLKHKGLSTAVKQEIEKLFEMNYKPKSILEHLKGKKIDPLPTLIQMNNYLNSLREEKYGLKSVDIIKIGTWLKEKSNIPSDESKMFVVAHEIFNSKFRFFLSSRKLLQNGIYLKHIQLDSTNKMEWIKYPIYIVGCSDQWNKFQCLGLAVCNSNELEDFEFLFKSLKDSIGHFFNVSINPTILVTDTCQNIQNAFLNNFGINSKIKICANFVKKDLKKKTGEFITRKDVINGILNDLNLIQKCSTMTEFQSSMNNFIEKWDQFAPEFVQYFQQEYIAYNSYWYDGYEPIAPKNNNAIEQVVKTLKNEDKQRKKISLSQLEVKLAKWIKAWSHETNLFHAKKENKSVD